MSIEITDSCAADSLEALKILAANYRIGGKEYNDDWERVVAHIVYLKLKLKGVKTLANKQSEEHNSNQSD